MMFKHERKRFWKNFAIALIKNNPARAALLPLAIFAFAVSLFIGNSSEFRHIHKHFQSKDGTHYYVLHHGTVESAKPLEIFEDSEGYYIKQEGFGQGKAIIVFIFGSLMAVAIFSLFIEDLEIGKSTKMAVLKDLRKIASEDGRRQIYVAYSKKIFSDLYSYGYTKKEIEERIPKMSPSALMELDDCMEKSEVRDRKLDQIGI
jgi:hypothetical protein